MKIGQLTSVHSRLDTRVFRKVSRSLAMAGHDVTLVVNDDQPDEVRDEVRIHSTGFVPRNRVMRIIGSQRSIYRAAIALDADVYQFHDPELLPIGVLLKFRGKRVIFDSHEDVPADLASKEWLPAPIRLLVSQAYSRLERWAVRRFDAVVSVTPHIVERLRTENPNAHLVTNYPIVAGEAPLIPHAGRSVCYCGTIDATWNIDKALKALDGTPDLTLVLAGRITPEYLTEISTGSGGSLLDFRGYVTTADVTAIYASALAGLALNDCRQLRESGGTLGNNKLFEIMYAGLPLICTNYPLWQQIIDETGCGICVDPNDPEEIAAAIQWLAEHPDEAAEMGRRGQQAVLTTYNWDSQAKELHAMYQGIAR